MRTSLQDEPLRDESDTGDGPAMWDMGNVHEPRPEQSRPSAGRRRTHRGSGERLRGTHKLEDIGTARFQLHFHNPQLMNEISFLYFFLFFSFLVNCF